MSGSGIALVRTEAPAFEAVRKVKVIEAKETSLDNNIPVYSVDAGTEDIVKIELRFKAGSWYQDRPLLASTTCSMLPEGAAGKPAHAIAGKFEYYGAYLETGTDSDFGSISLYCLNKYHRETLPMLAEVIQQPDYDESELATYLKNKKQAFVVDSQKVSVLARRSFAPAVFGPAHPYGVVAEEQHFDTLQQRQLVDFHRKRYRPANCRIIISGKVNSSMIDGLNNHFGGGDWNADQADQVQKAEVSTSKEKEIYIPRADALQSAIRIGKPLFNKTHPDYFGMQVLSTVLGGYFGSRLMSNIREDKGYTYGISSRIASLLHGGYFFIATEVGEKVTHRAIDEIHKEIGLLRTAPVPQDELQLVKNYMMGKFLNSIDGPFALADRKKGITDYDLDYSYYDRYIDTVLNITSDHLMELAGRYLKREDMITVVAGSPAVKTFSS